VQARRIDRYAHWKEGIHPLYLRGIPSMVLCSALCRAYLHIRSARFMSRSALSLLDHVFTTFSDMWRRMKEREKEAKAKVWQEARERRTGTLSSARGV
jgi:hypothetical protein